ncbi:MAG: 4Fe-4S binding protein [Cyanobacteria bacterium P01_H01_bin.74]
MPVKRKNREFGLNTPWRFPFHFFRGKLIQPAFWALFFLSPVFNVFRLDMIHQTLVWLGNSHAFSVKTLMWLPFGFYGAVIVIAIISFVWGRVFCGWACPHNTLTEWTKPVRVVLGLESKTTFFKRPRLPGWLKQRIPWVKKRAVQVGFMVLMGFILTTLLSVLLSFYVVPPDWVMRQYFNGNPHIALVMGHGLLLLIGMFLLLAGNNFCRACCPYGMAQSISAYHENSPWRPMEIQFSASAENDCKHCKACQLICPVDIDPRNATLTGQVAVGQFEGCFNCGECIDVCSFIHKHIGTKGDAFKKTDIGFLTFGYKTKN